MSRSAAEIESAIRQALRVCSLEAKGLWCAMRYVIEESDRPGHLRQNGRSLSTSQLAREAGCDVNAISPLQQELEEAGLLVLKDGVQSPLLARLYEVRAKGAERVRKFRALHNTDGRVRGVPAQPTTSPRKVLRNTDCNTPVTPGVTAGAAAGSPSQGFPPKTPLPIPPTPGSLFPGEPAGGGAEGEDDGERETAPDVIPEEDQGPPFVVKRRRKGGTQAEIDAIYQAYPKRVGKPEAKKRIAEALLALHERGDVFEPGVTWAAWLLGRVQAYAAACVRQKQADPSWDYIPHPSTWFHKGRYDDDPAAWEPRANRGEQRNGATHGHPRKDPRHGSPSPFTGARRPLPVVVPGDDFD